MKNSVIMHIQWFALLFSHLRNSAYRCVGDGSVTGKSGKKWEKLLTAWQKSLIYTYSFPLLSHL